MIKAVFKNGVIQPMEPLPSEWEDGQELVIEEQADAQAPPTAQELAEWEREAERLAVAIPAEEHERFRKAIAEIEEESKQAVRREWGLG